jgi:hypothetical protein
VLHQQPNSYLQIQYQKLKTKPINTIKIIATELNLILYFKVLTQKLQKPIAESAQNDDDDDGDYDGNTHKQYALTSHLN